jgi:predicted glycosyltransferase
MRILIDILHPAHVHFFRNFTSEMEERGHEIAITARAKDRSLELLSSFGLPFRHVSTQHPGRRTPRELLHHTRGLLKVIREFRPDVLTGIHGPAIALAGKLKRLPAVVFYDTEFATQTNRFVYPLAHSVCTPDCYHGPVRGTHRTYAGYHELAYLHPSRFEPDRTKLARFGVEPEEPYSVVRFVSWQAAHDRREVGLTVEQKLRLVDALAGHGRVLVSSEGTVPTELEPRVIHGPVGDVHHLLAFAQAVVGESATMSSEAAVLGVPAIFVAKTGRGYTDDLDVRYGLVRNLREMNMDRVLEQVEQLFATPPREFGRAARERMLNEKIDVTAWMVDYFESQFVRTP